MTEQYLQPSINGMPAPAMLAFTPAAGALAFGATNTSALAIPAASFAFDEEAYAVSNTAADGTVIQFLQPGIFDVELTLDGGAAGFINLLLGRTDALAITAGNGYPAASFVTPAGSGCVAIAEVGADLGFATARAVVRITDADVQLVGGNPNPAALLVLAATPALVPDGGTTSFTIAQVGA